MMAKLNRWQLKRPLSDTEAHAICRAVLRAFAQPGVEVILDVPDSARRVFAKASELVGGVEYELLENGEVIMSGGRLTPSLGAPRKARISTRA
jgi:alpha-D-ribose 1-methylphosphonate 5-triphosphate synthase subunit PhnH